MTSSYEITNFMFYILWFCSISYLPRKINKKHAMVIIYSIQACVLSIGYETILLQQNKIKLIYIISTVNVKIKTEQV